MKILIVDDEPLARTRLRQLVEESGDHTIVGEAANGLQAIEQANTLQPDTVLLDIRMPGMDGLEAGRHLSSLDQPPAIIFTTAYGEYALKAFEVHAVDYLLKPIRAEKLLQALDAARQITRAQMQDIAQENNAVRTHICARVRGNLKLIALEHIYYFKADAKYVEVHHTGGQVLIEESLKSLEDEFAGRLLRIHRNALVAPAMLAGLEKDDSGQPLALFHGTDDRLEISRRHLPQVRALLKGRG